MSPSAPGFLRSLAGLARRLFKLLALLIILIIVVTVIATIVVVARSGDPDFNYPRPADIVNDVTGLNPVRVGTVIAPASLQQIVTAVRDSEGPVSIGGGRYSQGGQVAYPDSLHIDMRQYDEVLNLDVAAKTVTVQPGITWRKLQQAIDPHDLAVKIMQTYADFTVGGSLSVNVHGRYIGDGPIILSVRSIQLLLADGTILTASPSLNSELFYGAIGGYGGLGVIVEATLELDDNVPILRRAQKMKVGDYLNFFVDEIRDNPDVVFHNADIYPPAYENVRSVSWYQTDQPVTITDRMIPEDTEYWWQPVTAEFVASFDVGKWLREYVMEPLYYLEKRIAWRNWEASYDIRELEPRDREKYTYVLREYFVPVDNFDAFVPKMAEIFQRNDVNILNVSVRHALPDPGTLLAWANEEVFAFVVYYRQGTDPASRVAVKAWSLEMIDAAIAAGGTWYLPYQIFASEQQFAAGYPRSPEYFALKQRVDPRNRFRNRLWTQHYPANRDALDAARYEVGDYYRQEEQTLLTIPEWYLVFNPKEYADYLASGNNPGEFPFIRSIEQYWTLYDRVNVIANAHEYPRNQEYLTMLRVIGVSTSLEYLVKASWESTVGRFTRWTAAGEDTSEDLLIQQAHRAYSDLIYDEAWYEFEFGDWLGRMWRDNEFFGEHFLRKLERKISFSMEFATKMLYAKVIKAAAESTYGETDKWIYLTASVPADLEAGANGAAQSGSRPVPDPVRIIASDGERQLMALPRWNGFTRALPQLTSAGYSIEDVSGNRRIAISLLVDDNDRPEILPGAPLFSSALVSNEGIERLVQMVPVSELQTFLRGLPASGATLEHIFDY